MRVPGTRWFIEGDIRDCVGSLDHSVMLSILAEHIHDGRFFQLIKRVLQAGYSEDFAGTPRSPRLKVLSWEARLLA